MLEDLLKELLVLLLMLKLRQRKLLLKKPDSDQ
jgi:hypothetical protein